MENNFYKITGLSLTIGSFLAITTMIIHPAGGNIQHIIELSQPLQFTHALAIFCLPFILFGFYGLIVLGAGRLPVFAFARLMPERFFCW